ncbi:NUDIX domain-containing protein [Herbidospora cretacea]|uniref:NUDIX domain-containing protein n=1 Tax=Herbidospora cretacea TaxID=28444 RepID=UPI0004C41173|nr:NUDIX domain-containing protein [Herbidospora cretacea]
MSNLTYTHPDVFTIGVRDGWADPETDPTRIDWAPRQHAAAIPFQVMNGRPLNPFAPTGVRYGRNELGHWGEQVAADAIVTINDIDGYRWLLMVERSDGHGWAVPGGYVDPGEDPARAAVRELKEETGLSFTGAPWKVLPARYVPDPRASDESWMVTVPSTLHLGTCRVADFPKPIGADDAKRAEWVFAEDYAYLVYALEDVYQGRVFAAHVPMLTDLLG